SAKPVQYRLNQLNGLIKCPYSFNWFSLYWTGFALLLMIVGLLFAQRGTLQGWQTRFKLARYRYTRSTIVASVIALSMFVGSGCFVYYNTNVLNEYQNSDERKELQANYERELSQYAHLNQPKIVETNLAVDIYPEKRDFNAKGYYYLKNQSEEAIPAVHIQLASRNGLRLENLEFDRAAKISQSYEDYQYYIYELSEALAPGDSVKMDFALQYDTRGFVEKGSNTDIVFNGTFFNSQYFPSLGYNDGFELSSDEDRKEYDFEPKELQLPRDDPRGLSQNLFGDDADYIRFEIELSTSPDQIAIAPGYLQREWEEAGRRHFHYKMDQPMVNFYSIVSARYEKIEEDWNGLQLEIYYHKGHEFNLDRMMLGMKNALGYYSENFSPYQYQQMRIMEFPRYGGFAQSFANTVPFSEGIGFVQQIEEDAIDMVFYVTAHEMAHQWWGHQVPEAGVRGNAMISESLSQYSALMVMKHTYPTEMIQKFLAYELDRYLGGRAGETKKENPLIEVQGQTYIHYRKGALAMYALQDYIGEDSVNAALRRFNQDWAYKKQGRYPNTEDLLRYFRAVTPDSMKYLITDMFETITLFENRTKEATTFQTPDGQYTVHLKAEAIKYRADSLGNETEIPLTDWMDIGVYGKSAAGKDSLLYLERHPVTQKEIELEITVPVKPTKAGIDPINKLIDRNPSDNVKAVTEGETIILP
ncbi:MAG: M1 family aminopeptidase, partial [Bacteroidota bacterium]